MPMLTEILLAHSARYPQLQLQDLFKLLYQSIFGCGHMVSDSSGALDYLLQEWEGVTPDAEAPLIEDIGNGFVRLHLAPAKQQQLAPEGINRLFVMSANLPVGSVAEYQEQLESLRELCREGLLPYDLGQFQESVQRMEEQGYPATHHSTAYRELYRPAYRVVRRDLLYLLPFLERLEALISSGKTVCLAIDGRSTSGKTSLARLLAETYHAGVIHMDDFFLPAELRTEERLREPGGNVHYERFMSEVAPDLKSGRPFSYRRFDCALMDYNGTVVVAPGPLRIVEGAYCLRPEFRHLYSMKVFMDLSASEQQKRLRQRLGDDSDALCMFAERWIPLEERYIAAHSLPSICDFVLTTTTPYTTA